uniref:Uncharacterized protein n=1 Tax=Rousettus aegyptiacus TaxID=9407 RepID=A0A7J8EJW5_ROUAE|nr:hypothetical protein HJG63_012514 [Rousettus aegyptiacus]
MGWSLEFKKVNRTPNYLKPKAPSTRHIVLKLSKINYNDKILRTWREKTTVTCKKKKNPIRLSLDFSAQILQARKKLNQIFKLFNEGNYQPRIMYLENFCFRYEGETKTFPDKQKLREFSTTRPAIQKILKGVSSTKRK